MQVSERNAVVKRMKISLIRRDEKSLYFVLQQRCGAEISDEFYRCAYVCVCVYVCTGMDIYVCVQM